MTRSKFRPMKCALSSLALVLALTISGCPQKGADGPVTGPSRAPATAASPSEERPLPATPVAPPQPVPVALENGLKPLPTRDEKPPVLTQRSTVTMVTNEGTITLEVYPEAAPNAAGRFLELVESGFYNGVPISRVVKTPAPFVAQFGINWRKPHNAWETKTFADDPSLFALERGTLCFAKAE